MSPIFSEFRLPQPPHLGSNFLKRRGSQIEIAAGGKKQPAPAPACLVLASGIGDGNFVSIFSGKSSRPFEKK